MTAVLVLIALTTTMAQDYQTGIGVRGGLFNGVTVKHFLSPTAAAEGILTTRWQGFNITGLYEIHKPLEPQRLKWYYGFGGHLGFWNGDAVSWADDDKDYTVLGIDGILGIEYSFTEVPVNISLDWKPAFNIIGVSGFWGDGGALSVRYIF